jgi:hypothetical protein
MENHIFDDRRYFLKLLGGGVFGSSTLGASIGGINWKFARRPKPEHVHSMPDVFCQWARQSLFVIKRQY